MYLINSDVFLRFRWNYLPVGHVNCRCSFFAASGFVAYTEGIVIHFYIRLQIANVCDVITQIYYMEQVSTLFMSISSNMPCGLSMNKSKSMLLTIVISHREALYSKL